MPKKIKKLKWPETNGRELGRELRDVVLILTDDAKMTVSISALFSFILNLQWGQLQAIIDESGWLLVDFDICRGEKVQVDSNVAVK